MRSLRSVAAVLLVLAARATAAQQPGDSTTVFRGLELEAEGKAADAVPFFKAGLHSAASVSALLGLERVYAELGRSDSLLPVLDTLIAAQPREVTFRSVQLRTLQALAREPEVRQAFERWTREVPGDPTPYRDYARMLLVKNLPTAADSVIARGAQALGSTADLQVELAQARAALGLWQQSATAWRPALARSPELAMAAAYALTPTPIPSRDSVREILLATPIEVGIRRGLSELELAWGSPANAWDALAPLPPDSSSAVAWLEFGMRAESEERWPLARKAFTAALRAHASRELAVRAAHAALEGGDPSAVAGLAPLSQADGDSALLASDYVPLHARALVAMGHPAEAARLVASVDKWLTPSARSSLARAIALGWARTGDMSRAREAVSAVGEEGDSSDAAGWIALYGGDLRTARSLLRASDEGSPELALALAVVARVRRDSSLVIGDAFLALARADSAGAVTRLTTAAASVPEAASLLLLTAARLEAARGRVAEATAIWRTVLERYGDSPEAPHAELAWARALRAAGDTAAATAHLEHLILTYPDSALLPQARRELDLLRAGVPGR